MDPMNKGDKKRGPVSERLHVKGNWGDAIKKAMQKVRPDVGWSKEEEPGDDDDQDSEKDD